MNSRFTKEQRNKIYKEALNHYKRRNSIYQNRIDGMCASIYFASKKLYNEHYTMSIINSNNFPEFYEFKPKATWCKNRAYWFTRNIHRGGYDKRISILTALAKGQSAEDWKKEWKVSGKR